MLETVPQQKNNSIGPFLASDRRGSVDNDMSSLRSRNESSITEVVDQKTIWVGL